MTVASLLTVILPTARMALPPALASAVTVPPEMVTAPLTWRAEEAALLSLYCSPCVVLLLVMVTVLPVKEALPPTWTVGTLLEALVAVREEVEYEMSR